MAVRHVTVLVEAIDKDYAFTIIEVCAPNAQPASFSISYNTETNKYHISQTGENNFMQAYPDERK